LPHRFRDGLDQRGIAVEVGEALAEIDGAVLGRQRRHHGEDRRADARQATLDRGRVGLGSAVVWLMVKVG
jgi:hypothetical protein